MQKKTILIVEDNDLNRSMLREILEKEYRILEAVNGRTALEILQSNEDSIALILLDLIMPVMDGYEFLEQMKENAEYAVIPVIVITQQDSDEDEVRALSLGATDFLSKPYRPQVILHRIANTIRFRETAALYNLLQYDRLTGLYTKEFFCRKVQECLLRNPDKEYNIICSNIENFKLYNDAFGKKQGDRLLMEMASSITELIGENGISCRNGADRFLWLQERETERTNRRMLSDENRTFYKEIHKNVSIKIGIYEIHNRTLPVERMCDRAFLAADSIKGCYNKTFAVYDDVFRGKLLREKHITDVMEQALMQQQFVVYFQPKYSLKDRHLTGAEALVRWNHPELGFLSPGEFIPIFEKNGFIPKLDQYVWEYVCAALSDWKKKGLHPAEVSVNVSRADVYQIDLQQHLTHLIERYGIRPENLHLEITESAYTENPSQIVSTIQQLANLGFVIEMDDFGSGYSSLNMLGSMNLDIMKLDMKFVQHEMEKPESESILNDIVSMAHRMKLRVVAEGIESKEQFERLRKINCDYAQGYYMAKPMPAAEYEKLMQQESKQAERK